MIRLGLFLYDHLGGRSTLPRSRAARPAHIDPAARRSSPSTRRGFVYSDCWVDDARLVVLNARRRARDAAPTSARARAARRAARRRRLGATRVAKPAARAAVRARALVNAAGPWVTTVLGHVAGENAPRAVRLVKGSHIVVPEALLARAHAYILQNPDEPHRLRDPLRARLHPDRHHRRGLSAATRHGARSRRRRRDYLCDAVNRLLRASRSRRPTSSGATRACARSTTTAPTDRARRSRATTCSSWTTTAGAPLLSVFGGKITTYRRLAEAALAKLAPILPRA